MRSPLTTIHCPSRTFPAVVSITRPVRMTIVGAGRRRGLRCRQYRRTRASSAAPTPDGARQRSVILLLPVGSSCGAPPAALPSTRNPRILDHGSFLHLLVHRMSTANRAPAIEGWFTLDAERPHLLGLAVHELRNVFFPAPGELLPQSRLLGDRVRGRRAVAHGPHLVVHQRLLRAARALRGAETLRALRDRRGRARRARR